MTDLTNKERAENEHSLDPKEKWGQGTDASHPISALDPALPAAATSDMSPTSLDDGEMTETANRLRSAAGTDLQAHAREGRDDQLPGDADRDVMPDDMPLA